LTQVLDVAWRLSVCVGTTGNT